MPIIVTLECVRRNQANNITIQKNIEQNDVIDMILSHKHNFCVEIWCDKIHHICIDLFYKLQCHAQLSTLQMGFAYFIEFVESGRIGGENGREMKRMLKEKWSIRVANICNVMCVKWINQIILVHSVSLSLSSSIVCDDMNRENITNNIVWVDRTIVRKPKFSPKWTTSEILHIPLYSEKHKLCDRIHCICMHFG